MVIRSRMSRSPPNICVISLAIRNYVEKYLKLTFWHNFEISWEAAFSKWFIFAGAQQTASALDKSRTCAARAADRESPIPLRFSLKSFRSPDDGKSSFQRRGGNINKWSLMHDVIESLATVGKTFIGHKNEPGDERQEAARSNWVPQQSLSISDLI